MGIAGPALLREIMGGELVQATTRIFAFYTASAEAGQSPLRSRMLTVIVWAEAMSPRRANIATIGNSKYVLQHSYSA